MDLLIILNLYQKTSNINTYKLENQVRWYREINMIYEWDIRVWAEVKTKRKIEK